MRRLAFGDLKAGMRSVRSTKLRSFWTMLGVIIGVASVITVVGIGEGVKQQISGQIHHMGKDVITIRPAAIVSGGALGNTNNLAGLGVDGILTSHDITTVATTHGVGSSAPLTIVSGAVHGDSGTYRDGYVIGTTPDLPTLLNQSIAYGAFLSSDNMGTNVAVLGQTAAQKMFNEDVPLGRSFTFRGQSFVVVGIFNQFASAVPLSQQVNLDSAIYIPNDVAENLTENTAPTYEILAKPSDPSALSATVAGIRRALNNSHGGQSDFSVTSGNQNIANSNYVLELLTRLVAGVAAISLLVGGIGIMNVMLVSVTERMHEIGIRKAVGATNRQILNQFMIESSLLSLAGGIIGVLVALVVEVSLRLLTNLQPEISWQVIVGAVVISLLVGVVFGSFPALKAARKDPIDALRAE